MCPGNNDTTICGIPAAHYIPLHLRPSSTSLSAALGPTRALRRLHLCADSRTAILVELWNLRAALDMLNDVDSPFMILLRQRCGVHFDYKPFLLKNTIHTKFKDAAKGVLREAFDLGLAVEGAEGECNWPPVEERDIHGLAATWIETMSKKKGGVRGTSVATASTRSEPSDSDTVVAVRQLLVGAPDTSALPLPREDLRQPPTPKPAPLAQTTPTTSRVTSTGSAQQSPTISTTSLTPTRELDKYIWQMKSPTRKNLASTSAADHAPTSTRPLHRSEPAATALTTHSARYTPKRPTTPETQLAFRMHGTVQRSKTIGMPANIKGGADAEMVGLDALGAEDDVAFPWRTPTRRLFAGRSHAGCNDTSVPIFVPFPDMTLFDGHRNSDSKVQANISGIGAAVGTVTPPRSRALRTSGSMPSNPEEAPAYAGDRAATLPRGLTTRQGLREPSPYTPTTPGFEDLFANVWVASDKHCPESYLAPREVASHTEPSPVPTQPTTMTPDAAAQTSRLPDQSLTTDYSPPPMRQDSGPLALSVPQSRNPPISQVIRSLSNIPTDVQPPPPGTGHIACSPHHAPAPISLTQVTPPAAPPPQVTTARDHPFPAPQADTPVPGISSAQHPAAATRSAGPPPQALPENQNEFSLFPLTRQSTPVIRIRALTSLLTMAEAAEDAAKTAHDASSSDNVELKVATMRVLSEVRGILLGLGKEIQREREEKDRAEAGAAG